MPIHAKRTSNPDQKLSIGKVALENRVILAPLAGITDLPFRLMTKAAGCGLVYSEMISANGLVHQSPKTERLLDSHPDEKPLAVQIFGSDPTIMAEAARIVEQSGADMLDINFGCSVKKILKTGSGAALMREPQRAEALLKAVRRATSLPLMIKIRKGWERSGSQALETARLAEACGVEAIAVHPRLATQGFRGVADWKIIGAVKRCVSIPVIGNGDITAPKDALRMVAETDCDAVMVGRAAIGNPMLLAQIDAAFRGRPEPVLDQASRFELMQQYVDACVDYRGEKQACFLLRSRLGWFSKGMRYSGRFRESIKKISSADQTRELIKAYHDALQQQESAPPHRAASAADHSP